MTFTCKCRCRWRACRAQSGRWSRHSSYTQQSFWSPVNLHNKYTTTISNRLWRKHFWSYNTAWGCKHIPLLLKYYVHRQSLKERKGWKKKQLRWSSHIYICFESHSQCHIKKKKAYRCGKFNAYCLLTCWDNSTPIFFPAKQLCDLASRSRSSAWAYVYCHAKFECHGLNIVWNITLTVQVKHMSSLRCNCQLQWRSRSLDWENSI